MHLKWQWWAVLAGSLVANACAARSPLARQECYNPDAQLSAVLQPLESRCAAGVANRSADCERLERELERLALVCPAHAPTLLANAVVAFDDHRSIVSQQWLDQLLSQSPSQPEAAVLRAQIAIQDGNLAFARRLLAQQIKLTPDRPALHEAYGAALYLDRDLDQAGRELTIAAALGAPRWRSAYHLGLIEEALGRFDEAARYYAEALEANPGWAPAESRLTALRASSK